MIKEVKTCGKLYIAGEYAILMPNQGAIIKNIPIYMTGKIEFSQEYRLFSDLFDYAVDLSPDSSYSLLQETIQIMNEYITSLGIETCPFSLSITGKMGTKDKKFGLGSSGSVVLLVLKAMVSLYDLSLDADRFFKLASYILLKRGDNGSMGDLACIAYEELVYYQSFNRKRIKEQIEKFSLLDCLESDWEYIIRPILVALPVDFLVGWTKEPAISKNLINSVESSIDADFLLETQTQVKLLEKSFQSGSKETIKLSLEKISQLLTELNPAIYTDKLIQLKQASQGLDCVAKSSGAGGGDCGIALSFSQRDSACLIERWEQSGIQLLYKERMGTNGEKS